MGSECEQFVEWVRMKLAREARLNYATDLIFCRVWVSSSTGNIFNRHDFRIFASPILL
jgi:hypothetical protein